MLKEAIDCIESIAVIIASITAVWGILKWRFDFREKRKMELAEESLALFYEARDMLNVIRSPLGMGNPEKHYEQGEGESSEAFAARKRVGSYFERLEKHGEVFQKIHAMRYRFMKVFSEDAAKPFSDMNKIINYIMQSAHSLYARLAHPVRESGQRYEEYLSKVHELEGILWRFNFGTKDDDIIKGVDNIIKELESTLSHY